MLAIIGFIVLVALGGYLLFATWGIIMVSVGLTGKFPWLQAFIFFGLACGVLYFAFVNSPFTLALK